MTEPSGENATVRTLLSCPRITLSASPDFKSHVRTVRSSEPETMSKPSGEKATEVTGSVCPRNFKTKLAAAEAELKEAKASARDPQADYEKRVAKAEVDVKELEYKIKETEVKALLAEKAKAGTAWTGEEELAEAKRDKETARKAWEDAKAAHTLILQAAALPQLPAVVFDSLDVKMQEEDNLFEYVSRPAIEEQIQSEAMRFYTPGDLRGKRIPVAVGGMGRGKTMLGRVVAKRAAEAWNGGLALTINLFLFTTQAREQLVDDGASLLAQALVYAYAPDKVPDKVKLGQVLSHFASAGVKMVVFHLDEIQNNFAVSLSLIKACVATVNAGSEVRVVALPTGIELAKDKFGDALASSWTFAKILVPALEFEEGSEFERVFAKAVGMTVTEFRSNGAKPLRTMFRDCAGIPSLAKEVAHAAIDYQKQLASKSLMPSISSNDARVIYERALGKISGTYGASRWHSITRPPRAATDDDARKRDSWEGCTNKLLRRVLLDLLAGCEIPRGDAQIISYNDQQFTYESDDVVRSGMVTLANGKLAAPIMAVVSMNRSTSPAVVSLATRLENPFIDDALMLEEVSVVSLAAHGMAWDRGANQEQWVDVNVLRPGAQVEGLWCAADALKGRGELAGTKVEIDVTGFNPKVDQLAMGLMRASKALFEPGNAFQTAADEPAIDAFVVFKGRYMTPAEQRKPADKRTWTPCIVRVWSQSQWRESCVPESERASQTMLGNKYVETCLDQMRAAVKGLKLPDSKKAVFNLYDLFSDRHAPVKPALSELKLAPSEALFVTRGTDAFIEVAAPGETLSVRKRQKVE